MHTICIIFICMLYLELRHPNIVPLIGVSFEVGSILLIMKYIEGKSLHNILFIECLEVSVVNVCLKSSTFLPS